MRGPAGAGVRVIPARVRRTAELLWCVHVCEHVHVRVHVSAVCAPCVGGGADTVLSLCRGSDIHVGPAGCLAVF